MTTQERAQAFKWEWESLWSSRGSTLATAIPDVGDLKPMLDDAVAEEREACARLADREAELGSEAARKVAEAIRARR